MAGSPSRPSKITPAVILPILQSLGSEDDAARTRANKMLVSGRDIPGYLPSMIQVASKADMAVDLRIQAAIAAKECCVKLWGPHEGVKVAPADADAVRQNIIPATLGISEIRVVRLLGRAAAEIFYYDYQQSPAASKMPEQIVEGFSSRDSSRIRNSTLVWFELCKQYSHKGYDGPERRAMPDFKREPSMPTRSKFDKAIAVVNPILQRLAQSAYKAMSPDSWYVLRYCIKAFFRCNQSTQSGPYLSPDGCMDWLKLCAQIAQLPLPEPGEPGTPSGQPTDPEQRRHWPFWKAKKWALRIGTHFMNRFNSGAKRVRYEAHKPFVPAIENVVAPAFTKAALDLLARKANRKYLPDRLQTQCLQAVRQATAPAKTWEIVKAALEMLMTKFVPEAIAFKGDAADLWAEDALRYVAEIISEDATVQLDRVSIASAVRAMLRMRGAVIAPKMLHWCVAQFKRVKTMPVGQEQARQLVSLLGYVDMLAEYLVKYRKRYAAMTEPVLTMGIMPCLKYPAPFVRAHACATFGHYAGFPWKESPLRAGVASILGLLDDRELAVRLSAVMALRNLASVKRGADVLHPHAGRLVGVVITAMQKMPVNDDIVDALVALIRRFTPEVQSQAPAILKTLVESSRRFLLRAAEGDEEDREADMADMAAERAIEAIQKLIAGMPIDSPALAAMEREVAPIVSMFLRHDEYAVEFADVVTGIVRSMVTRHTSETMTPITLALVDDMIMAVTNYLPDYMEFVVKIVRPLVARAPWCVAFGPSIEAGMTRLQLLWRCCQKVSNVSEADCQIAMQLAAYVIMVGNGHCDDFVRSQVLPHAVKTMQNAEAPGMIKTTFSMLASACVLYNPALALDTLEKLGGSVTWMQCINGMLEPGAFTCHEDAKLNTIAVARLLLLAPKLPPSIMGALPRVFATLIKLVVWKMESSEDDDSDAEVERAGGAPSDYEHDAEAADAKAEFGDAPDYLDEEQERLIKEARAMLGISDASRVPMATLERVESDDEEKGGVEGGDVEADDDGGFGEGDDEAKLFESDLDPLTLAAEFDMDYSDFENGPKCHLFDVAPAYRTDSLLALQATMSHLSKMGPDRMRALVGALPADQRKHLDEYAEMAEQRKEKCSKTQLGVLARGILGPEGGLAPFQAKRPSSKPPVPARIPTFDIGTYLKHGRIVSKEAAAGGGGGGGGGSTPATSPAGK